MEEQEKQVDGGVKSHYAGGGHIREQRLVEKRGRGAGKSTWNFKSQSLIHLFCILYSNAH